MRKIVFRLTLQSTVPAVMGGVLLAIGCFLAGYCVGSEIQENVSTVHVEEPLDSLDWLTAFTKEIPPFQEVVSVAPAESLMPTLTIPVSGVSQSGENTIQKLLDGEHVEDCLKRSCDLSKASDEDWQWRGFSPSNVEMLTQKYTFTQSVRAQCERALSGIVSTHSKARKKLECLRTMHREAQCAVLVWNLKEPLPSDANGKLILRSAVALNLMVDFFVNRVTHPHHISLCFGDISDKYRKFVISEAKAYQKSLQRELVRQSDFDLNFCAQQEENLAQVKLMDDFLRVESLSGFSFPAVPSTDEIQTLRTKLCRHPAQLVTSD